MSKGSGVKGGGVCDVCVYFKNSSKKLSQEAQLRSDLPFHKFIDQKFVGKNGEALFFGLQFFGVLGF